MDAIPSPSRWFVGTFPRYFVELTLHCIANKIPRTLCGLCAEILLKKKKVSAKEREAKKICRYIIFFSMTKATELPRLTYVICRVLVLLQLDYPPRWALETL